MRKKTELLLLCGTLFLAGCGRMDKVEQTTVYADRKKGTVQEVIIEPYTENDNYTEEELKAYIDSDVASENQEAGETKVTVTEVKLEEGIVTIRMEYTDSEAYAAYHRTAFFAGTLSQAQEKGFDFAGTFVDGEGNPVDIKNVLAQHPEYQVVIVEEPVQVLTDKEILYMTTNVKKTSSKAAEATGENGSEKGNFMLSSKAYVISKQ